MKKFFQNLFGASINEKEVQASAIGLIAKFSDSEIAENDALPFWENLPVLGRTPEEQSKLIMMIRDRHKADMFVNPYHNRRRLYQSLLYLRNESETGWKLDMQFKPSKTDGRSVLERFIDRMKAQNVEALA